MSTKKKVKSQGLTLDHEENAIVAHYLTLHYDQDGELVDQTPGSKKVRLPVDYVATEVAELSQEIVDKCKYIPSSKVHEVQQLLVDLLNQRSGANRKAAAPQGASANLRQTLQQQREAQQSASSQKPPGYATSLENLLPPAQWSDMDDYADLLYEDKMDLKVRGAKVRQHV